MDYNARLDYKGYTTHVRYSDADGVFYGRVENTNDLITFESKNAIDAPSEFHKAVDGYLRFCKEVGKKPEKCSIKFLPGNRVGIATDPEKGGIIEVRPGLKDVNLGEKKYAMAYIRVLDEHHYIKGMCLYSDTLPDGYDVIKYCLDPKDCLKAVKDARDIPKKFLNKGVMTKIQDKGNWKAFEETFRSDKLASSFHKRGDKNI